MTIPSPPVSDLEQERVPEEQSPKQSQIEGHSNPGDVGYRSQVPLIYNPKANIETTMALKDCVTDVDEHHDDEHVELIDGIFQVQQLALQKLLNLKISRSHSLRSCKSRRASTGSISDAISNAAIQELKATAKLSSDAVTAIKNDLGDFKATIVQSFLDIKRCWAEHKRGVESHFSALEGTSTASSSTRAGPRDFEPLPPPSQPEPYSTLPPYPVANRGLEVDKFVAFVEVWDRNRDYSGELYDILDDKVREMLSLCYGLGIHTSQLHAIFPRILTGRARAYYFDEVHHDDTFATAYKKVKDYFDDAINHNIYHTDWTTITFESFRKDYRAKHPGPEDLQKVLQSMLDKLKLCQRALGPAYAADIHLRDAVLRACRGVPEFEYACFNAISKPLQHPEELFSLLRISLRVYLDCRPSRSQPAQRVSRFDVY